jgi:LysR family transcriptional regulator, glycine cleavage system transcriptional activator
VDAAVSGMGVALESTLMMSAEFSSGSLVCPIEDPPPIQVTSQWILYSPDRMRHEKVRLFLDWLKREREEWRAGDSWPLHRGKKRSNIRRAVQV